jgi:putative ATP-dependent endonuclease of OLD family
LIQGKFCQEAGILQSTGAATVDELTPDTVAKFCRDKGKVEAATCIAEVLTPAVAEKIGSVSRLLRTLSEMSQQ